MIEVLVCRSTIVIQGGLVFKLLDVGYINMKIQGCPGYTERIMPSTILMEESPESKLGRVSFARQHRLSSYTSGRHEKMDPYKALEHLNKKKPSSSSSNHSLEVPKSPHEAMEFLSRSWSPSASDFFQIFSSDSLSLPPHDENGDEIEKQNHDEKTEITGTKRASAQRNKETIKGVENIWKWLAGGRTLFWVLQRHKSLKNNWMNMRYTKGWFRGQSILPSFIKGRKDKKTEEIRLETAKVHAALSVARLAAAVAGFAAKSGFELEDINGMATHENGSWNQGMAVVFASAAALVATVCAEAAESAGAHRAHVAAAVNSGLAITASSDMITLTATAATCNLDVALIVFIVFAETEYPIALVIFVAIQMLNVALIKYSAGYLIALVIFVAIQMLTVALVKYSGDIKLRMFSIYLKHNSLLLRSGKKYLGGFLTSSKEYKIMNVIKETKEAPGFHPIRLVTNVGKIVLLFEDEKQCNIWKSTISRLLQNQSSFSTTDAATQGDT
ncbi:hypothetical protein NE237_030357 [Protea cynaroides]|uniref:PH domain-containing protein n=1 Tax=Protea cynaroides TaxID=273540 RepID=A0A9Q0JWW8_9MAGN|nr:hypothetical protein NE237_030357 [Protea cynaroides]